MIEVKNITKRYGEKIILDNVSLQIPNGKITAFIGPNGAGKSTLLSIISRLLSKDEGQVLIDGKDISKWDNNVLSKKIAILKQANHLNIRLRVEELVSFGRYPYSQGNLNDEDKRIVEEAMSYMGLLDIRHRFLDQLSGGQRQRAYIAMVVAQNTDTILLDEPLNNLDMKHSVEIMKTLNKLARDLGKTVVIVIHDINFASCYADHIVALKDGKILANGPTDKIIQEKVLRKVYEMSLQISSINGQRICTYY